ncbi:3732_t:CDS:2, partial [Acaulospora colombiana]
VNDSSQVKHLDASQISSTSTIFLRLCDDVEYTVDCTCTKIMIEECKNLVLIVNDKIITSMIEVWKSDNITLKLKTQVHTIQVDQCGSIRIQYESVENFHSVVWNNTREIELKLSEGGEEKYTLSTGDLHLSSSRESVDVENVKPPEDKDQEDSINEAKPLNPYQYIIRLINDQLTTEELIRAEKGFPTTEREWTDWKRKNNIP